MKGFRIQGPFRFLDRYAVATMVSRDRIMLRRVTVD